MLFDQHITSAPADMKEAVARMVDEPVHRIAAVHLIEQKVTEPWRAIRKGGDEFHRGHVIVGEPLDQHGGAVLLCQAPLSYRNVVAEDPWPDGECDGCDEYCRTLPCGWP